MISLDDGRAPVATSPATVTPTPAQVYVFGHRNPDTDAICSAVAYADLLQKTTIPTAVAACCGPPNARTEFVLQEAGIKPPRIIADIRPTVLDACETNIVAAHDGESFFEVYGRFSEHNVRAIPVLAKDGKLTGVLTLLNMLRLVFEGEGQDSMLSRQIDSNLETIRAAVGGRFLHESRSREPERLFLMVGAMSAPKFTERMHRFPSQQLLVVSGDRPTIHEPSIENKVRGLVVTGGFEPTPELLKKAKANDVSVIVSPHDTATTVLRIKSARGIASAINHDFLSFSHKQLMEEGRQAARNSEQSMFPIVDDEGKLLGVISRSDFMNPPKPKIILVDHNELGQAVLGAESADILQVLDHHRLGGAFTSQQPIRFINEPVGSTCTLVTREFRAAGLTPSQGISLCLASGIISDTLFLRSPTATHLDREMLAWLETLCGRNLETFAKEFFAIGSALRNSAAKQVILEDCKEFTEHGVRFSISQIEEIGFDLFWSRKWELFSALENHASARGLAFSALLVTDISTNSSLLLLSRELSKWESIGYPRLEKHLYELSGIVSRKKQLLPLLLRIV